MSQSPGGSMCVLHVDDDPGVTDLTAAFLERETDRMAVETATTADEGLERLDGTYDCVVSDYDMPGMDGIEFLEAVREEHPHLPFILYTGKGSEAVASDAISAGATDYLQKRTGTEQYELLANSIERAVDERRAIEALESERDRLSVLFENATDAIAFYEFEGAEPVARMINPAFEETFGVDGTEVRDRSLDDVVVPPERVDEARRINERVRAGEPVETAVVRRAHDGERTFRLLHVPLAPGEGVEGGFAIYAEVSADANRSSR